MKPVKVMWMSEELATLILSDGLLKIVARESWVPSLIEKYRRPGMTDAQLLESLPRRATGMFWAGQQELPHNQEEKSAMSECGYAIVEHDNAYYRVRLHQYYVEAVLDNSGE